MRESNDLAVRIDSPEEVVPMRRRRSLVGPLAAWMLSAVVAASEGRVSVRGEVTDAASGSPLVGAEVRAGDRRAVTGDDGRFTLEVDSQATLLEVRAEGYAAARRPLSLDAAAPPAPLTIALLPGRFHEQTSVIASIEDAPAAARVEVLPVAVATTAGGAENVFRTLHTLPGVAATEEFGSRLSVRGGGPDENLTVMDGVEVHNPYRLFGLSSAFNPEIIESFNLYAGGFSARYGDRLSSLLVVENRAGRATKPLQGSAALSLTDANVVAEGRLPGRGRGSWLLTGRRTYYDLAADAITGTELPSFSDLQAKVVYELGPGHRLSVFGLRSRETTDALFDDTDVPGERFGLVTATVNDVASLSHSSTLGPRAVLRTTAAYNDNSEGLDAEAQVRYEGRRSNAPSDDQAFPFADIAFARTLAVRDLSVREELSWQAGAGVLLEAGFELHRLETRVGLTITGERNPTANNGSSVEGGAGLPDALDSALDATRLGSWLQGRWTLGALVVEPGLRLDRSTVNRRNTISPRLGLSRALGASTRVRAAAGLYTQSPGYEKLVQADYFFDLRVSRQLQSERALHALVGFERDFASGWTARVEAYWKQFDRLIVGRLETDAERQARLAEYAFPAELQGSVPSDPIITDQPTNDGQGGAWGFDLFLTRAATAETRLSGWASYTYGVARREVYGRTYPFDYDRRHAFTLAATWRAKPWLDLATTTRVSSGFPRTPALGLRVAAEEEGVPTVLVPMRDGTGLLVYEADYGGLANLNAARLPLFARVDFRATFHPRGRQGRWQLYVDVINLLNRKNAGRVETQLQHDPGSERPRREDVRTEALPILPSIGVRLRF
jgi:hypothetical protein